MIRRSGLVLMLAFALAITGSLAAQDTEKKMALAAPRADRDTWSFYKLDLTVREMDGSKAVNSRTYTITQRASEWGQLRVGSQVPTEKFGTFSVGLNLDSRVLDRDEAASFDWRVELSSLAESAVPNGAPLIRQVKNNGQTLLSFGKPTLMATVDDASSTHKFVFEVTATKLK